MSKILKIFDRITLEYVKKRTLLTFLIVQNVIFALIVLIFANVIISNANVTGELDYNQIKNFYMLVIILLYTGSFIVVPVIISPVLYTYYKNHIMEHLMAVKIDIDDIVFAVFIRGFSLVLILFFSALPIASVAFYFGGFGIIKLLKLLTCLIFYILLLSVVCIYISTRILDGNLAVVVSYIVCLFLLAFNLLTIRAILASLNLFIIYVAFISIVALILLSLARKTTIFKV